MATTARPSDAVDIVFSDLTPQQKLMFNQILKTYKVNRTNKHSVTLRFFFTPHNTPAPTAAPVEEEKPQGEADFSELLKHLGKMRFTKTTMTSRVKYLLHFFLSISHHLEEYLLKIFDMFYPLEVGIYSSSDRSA